MTTISPFTQSRFEYEDKHMYFLPKDTIDELEGIKPSYLIGSRGTGKTTLLQALSWKERLWNDSLRRQISKHIFEKGYVGIYLKLPKFELSIIEKWLQGDRDALQSILGLYFDLIWVELLLESIVELSLEGIFNPSPNEENKIVKIIFNYFGELKKFQGIPHEHTFLNLSNTIRETRREIEKSARNKRSVVKLIDILPTGQIGEFGFRIGNELAKFCNRMSKKNDMKWYFKICMDEAECLSSFQQILVNSLIRISEYPVSFVFSYVRLPDDTTNTLIPNLTLQKADRNLIQLDEMNYSKFKELAEGVATVRLREISLNSRATFNTEKVLGELNIDKLIEKILRVSENPKANELLNKAKEYKKIIEVKTGSDKIKKKRGMLPLYKTYLIDRLKIDSLGTKEQKKQIRQQDSAQLRKKLVSAYLCLCKEFNVKVRYGFAEMVFQMSDKSVRDYLAQINEVFNQSNLSIKQFVIKRVPISIQDIALKKVSQSKRDYLPKSGVQASQEIERLIDGLGQITEMVQTEISNFISLRSTERGIFELDTSESGGEQDKRILRLINEASEAGFIKIYSNEGTTWSFRVHCSLAAAYGFSYRGAYYKTPIKFSDLRTICKNQDVDEFKKNIKKIGKRLSGLADPQQIELFGDEVNGI